MTSGQHCDTATPASHVHTECMSWLFHFPCRSLLMAWEKTEVMAKGLGPFSGLPGWCVPGGAMPLNQKTQAWPPAMPSACL